MCRLVVETWYIVCVSCIWCICSSCCCVELHEIQENCKTATSGSYLTLQLLFIQICSLDIWIWCILCIFNTVPHAEYNFIRKNRKRVKFGSAEYDTVHIQFIPTIQAFTNSNPFSCHWDMIYCMYMMYFVYMQQRFLCRAQLNSKKIAHHQWPTVV